MAGTPNDVEVWAPGVYSVSTTQGADRGGLTYGQYMRPGGTSNGPYYRILVYAKNAGRNTVSVTETLVHY